MARRNTKTKGKDISRAQILEAAKKLFLNRGYQATSIRKIASAIDISPTTIYLYYKDKAEIIYALHQEGFKLLNKQFETLHLVEDPYERLKAMGRCYLDFAIDNPGYYELMFIIRESLKHLQNNNSDCENSEWDEGKQAFQSLINTVEDCIQNGYFKDANAKILALLVWSNLHGLCTLKNNGQLGLIANKTIKEEIDTSQIIQSSFNLYADILKNYKGN